MGDSSQEVINSAKENMQEPLRVSQLDASELDTELFEVLYDRFDNIFKYFKPTLLLKLKPEINATLRLLIWKYTIGAYESSIGQQLLELRYKNEGLSEDHPWMNGRQKVLHALLTVGGSWLEERIDDLATLTEEWKYSEQIWIVIEYFRRFWKVAALINFLVFLTRGRYQFLIERLLRIRAVFPAPQGVRQVGFEYMDRELLWHGFAEFLFFVLPLINFRRMKNFMVRHLLTSSKAAERDKVERSDEDYEECVICEETPFNPHQIGCHHVFCYYCIRSNFMADPAYTCPVCGQAIPDVVAIQPVKIVLSQRNPEPNGE